MPFSKTDNRKTEDFHKFMLEKRKISVVLCWKNGRFSQIYVGKTEDFRKFMLEKRMEKRMGKRKNEYMSTIFQQAYYLKNIL